MAITFLQAKKRQKNLLLILVLVIIAILVIVWQGFLKVGKAPVLPYVTQLTPREINIDLTTLENPQITELQAFEEILPFEDEIGRTNPFIPY